MKKFARFVLALTLALLAGVGTVQWPARGAASSYCGYPYFFIASVVKDTSVTITPYNFPANDTFTVTMGLYGTYGIGGIVVDTVTTDASGHLSKTTFSIPAALAGQARIAIRLESPTSGYYAYNWFWNNTVTTLPGHSGYPYFFISSVVKDTSVTIDPHNFTPNDTYKVLMGYYGTYGIGGIEVDTVTTDASGNLSKTTFNIPAALAGQVRIAIRLESPTTGYYAYNWFWNNTATAPPPGYSGHPYFFITDVVKDTSVTIDPHNFTPNDTYKVLIGLYGTYGIGGIEVDTVTTDASGNLSKTTFNIPAALAGQVRLAIRLESPTTGYYAYNWFWNNTTSGSGGSGLPGSYTGYPYFFIPAVVRNTSVTIKPHNFTPNDTYKVLMGYYGTYGIGGIEVDTVTTDAHGNLSKTTFSIPAALAGQTRIAIRLESPTTGYYAYNWFWNFTATVPVP